MAAQVCIVATVCEPAPIIESFIRYHLAMGVTHLFLFFDDPADEAIEVARPFSQVTAIPSDDALRAMQTTQRIYGSIARFAHEVMARQILNVETAVGLALQMGMDWIIHIDGDELLYLPGSLDEFFDFVTFNVGQISFRNFEGVPETWEVANYFQEVTLFKRHEHLLPPGFLADYRLFRSRENYLLGYGNGKSAARVVPGLLPSGVHAFSTTASHPQFHNSTGAPVVLHYINCGFENYHRKYQRLCRDTWLGVPVPFQFYTQSRRLTGDATALQDLYRREVLFDDPLETDYLIAKGILTRIIDPVWLATGEAVPGQRSEQCRLGSDQSRGVVDVRRPAD